MHVFVYLWPSHAVYGGNFFGVTEGRKGGGRGNGQTNEMFESMRAIKDYQDVKFTCTINHMHFKWGTASEISPIELHQPTKFSIHISPSFRTHEKHRRSSNLIGYHVVNGENWAQYATHFRLHLKHVPPSIRSLFLRFFNRNRITLFKWKNLWI